MDLNVVSSRTWAKALAALVFGLSSFSVFAAIIMNGASASSADDDDATDQFIVKLRDPSPGQISRSIQEMSASAAVNLTYSRQMSGNAHVVKIPKKLKKLDADVLAQRIAQHPNVASVEPDSRMYPQLLPNDPMYDQQWHYHELAGGINLPSAWDITTGSSSIVVAVIDTGIRTHADLAGRVLPGYDFITNVATANDGNGRDADPSDSGDAGCGKSTSTWHGTHVAGTIGAASNNSSGVSGISWGSKILPLRVLGVCGGYTSDIVDALRWASGISIPGAPQNTTPARVANLSLGGANGGCSTTFQNAVNDVTARGTVVVVAAGNSNADASTFEPANCAGVVTVSATGRSGNRSSYSNFGAKVAIAAPGGSGSNGVLSTLNAGQVTPGADSYAYYQGTSMSAPHVSGTASLMLSANPALTPAQVKQILLSTARQFPTGTGADCSTAVCGAGIVDAGSAVAAALAAIAPPPPPPSSSINVALATSGAVATASSTYSNVYPAAAVINGDRKGSLWGQGGGWNDASSGAFPDWVQVAFNGSKSIAEINLFTIQDNYSAPQEPTPTLSFNSYGITDFEVQYWDGSSWQPVPGGVVSGNNKVWRKFSFAPITTTRIRVLVTNALGSSSRITEIEAYETTSGSPPPTPTPTPTPTANVASQASGGVASATSTHSAGFAPAGTNNGDRRGSNWGAGGGWNSATAGLFPQALQVNFNGMKSISEIDVVSVQDAYSTPSEPTASMTFSLYGITDFDVQYWISGTWVTVPGGSVNGNNLVWRKFTFPSVATTAIRVNVRSALGSYARIVEVEAY